MGVSTERLRYGRIRTNRPSLLFFLSFPPPSSPPSQLSPSSQTCHTYRLNNLVCESDCETQSMCEASSSKNEFVCEGEREIKGRVWVRFQFGRQTNSLDILLSSKGWRLGAKTPVLQLAGCLDRAGVLSDVVMNLSLCLKFIFLFTAVGVSHVTERRLLLQLLLQLEPEKREVAPTRKTNVLCILILG